MAVLGYLLVLFLSLTGYSNALYCVCREGMNTSALQKTLDYACGAGADCTPILQNGACYQPNTIQDHCSYAVNSYYQRKNQIIGSCDFAGTATTSATPPSTAASTCTYPASASAGGTGTSTGTNTTNSTGTTTTNGGTPTTTGGTTSTSPSVYNLGPTGSGLGDSGAVAPLTITNLLIVSLALWFSCLVLVFWG